MLIKLIKYDVGDVICNVDNRGGGVICIIVLVCNN